MVKIGVNIEMENSKFSTTVGKGVKILLEVALIIACFFIAEAPVLAEIPNFKWDTLAHANLLKHTLILLGTTVFSFAVLYFVYKRINDDFRVANDKAGVKRGLLITLLTLAPIYVIADIISYYGHVTDADLQFEYGSNLLLIFIICAAIVSPIMEELLFQGIIQGGLFKKLNPAVAIIITAGLFSLVHGNIDNLLKCLVIFIQGLSYAYIYYKTKDIRFAILGHGLNNFLAIMETLMLIKLGL